MKAVIAVILTCAMCLSLTAQDKLVNKPKPPAITAEQRAAFWKSQVAIAQAQEAMKQAQEKAQTIVKEMQATCGSSFYLQPNPDSGEPECVDKQVGSKAPRQ